MNTLAPVDIAVIGGGPAGVSACLELSKDPSLNIVLFESETKIGGIPKTCHYFFGMRDMNRLYSGPSYAQKLDTQLRKTPVKVYTNSTVLSITPGEPNQPHRISVCTPEGVRQFDSRFILVATGCYERSREARRIPGTRPAGIFTTGTLQQTVNFLHTRPGEKALVIGSEHVALSAVLTLRRAGVAIAGLVSEERLLHTYPSVSKSMSLVLGYRVYPNSLVDSIFGKRRVEGVRLIQKKTGKTVELSCDTIVCAGNFRPDASLIYKTIIKEDPLTLGPSVDMNYATNVPGIYAAGNVLRGAEMHDLCALEGKQAARSILQDLSGLIKKESDYCQLRGIPPIRYVAPQKVIIDRVKGWKTSSLRPGFSFQVAHTVRFPVVEAWCDDKRIWSHRYTRLIANCRVPLPIEKFNWSQAIPSKAIDLKLKA